MPISSYWKNKKCNKEILLNDNVTIVIRTPLCWILSGNSQTFCSFQLSFHILSKPKFDSLAPEFELEKIGKSEIGKKYGNFFQLKGDLFDFSLILIEVCFLQLQNGSLIIFKKQAGYKLILRNILSGVKFSRKRNFSKHFSDRVHIEKHNR